jgi:hypothetical protein
MDALFSVSRTKAFLSESSRRDDVWYNWNSMYVVVIANSRRIAAST